MAARLLNQAFRLKPVDEEYTAGYEVRLARPVTLEGVARAVGGARGAVVMTGEGGALELESDEQLNKWIGEGGAKVVVVKGEDEEEDPEELQSALQGHVDHLTRMVDSLRAEKQSLIGEVRDQSRTISIQQHQIAVLEQSLRVAQGVEEAATPGIDDFAIAAAPTEPPPREALQYDAEYCGSALDIENDGTVATATHSYNKLALCAPGFDAAEEAYAEFTITTAFSRFTAIGVVLEDALGRVNVNTDGLGDSSHSYAWYGHKYWTSCFSHNGESQGPRGGEWQKGSRVGVLVSGGCISFYLDGQLRHQHVFRNVKGRFRFAVGFGGPRAPKPDNCFGEFQINAAEV
eukprot:TRINITY_DN23081_c0_g1_i1.p1 TRINITY_DN23081_c0_g1~~TRINITY_DN23081_c0_g1_i1.p1  ORF type:complete len:383 (+),score=124.97 TRINITY_DN23081_c0_g1_i1:112-1149(+)